MLDTLIKALIALNWFGATWAVALDISNAFEKVKYAGCLQKLKSYGISGQISGLISFSSVIIIEDFKWFWMGTLHNNIQLTLYFLKAPFLLYINDLPDDVICDTAICADDTTFYSKYDQASDLWQQLELASKLESNLWDTVDWSRKWFVDFNSGKTQLD